MDFTQAIDEQVRLVAQLATAKRHRLVTAESCTGGMIASTITDLAGSSAWFEGAWVTYHTRTKIEHLGVPAGIVDKHGVVSGEVAMAMCRAALGRSHPDVTMAVSVTGSAGPDSYPGIDVGCVFIGWAYRFNEVIISMVRQFQFAGTRNQIRQQTTLAALQGLKALMEYKNPAKEF